MSDRSAQIPVRVSLPVLAPVMAAVFLLLSSCGGGSNADSTAEERASANDQTESDRDSAANGDGSSDGDGSAGDGGEPALTSDFCGSAVNLIGSMETVGVADVESPVQLRLAYENTSAGLAEVAELAPDVGIANQIGDLKELFDPLVDLLRSADWDLTAIDPDEIAELEVLSESTAVELEMMTDDFEGYVSAECDVDIEEARAIAVDDFFYQFVDTPPRPEDNTDDGADDDAASGGSSALTLEDVPIGTRGGEVFCEADEVWNNVMALVMAGTVAADDAEFLDPFLQSADIYTKWGERMPVEIAVRTVEMNVGYAEVVAAFGNTQDISATRAVFLNWRGGASYQAGREAVDSWIEENCAV